MKKTLMLAMALVAAFSTVSAGQTDGASIAGSWTARFEGRTFLRLELKTENGTITGAMSMGNIEVDKQGALSRADESPRGYKVVPGETLNGYKRVYVSDPFGNRIELMELQRSNQTNKP